MAPVARRHHTVPRFYLNGFAREQRIGTVRLPGRSRFVQSTQNATTHNNFYSIDGPESDAFEKALSEVEGKAAGVWREILEGTWPLSPDSRNVLAEFAAIQYLRGPNHRAGMEQVAAAVTQAQITTEGRDGVRRYLREEGIEHPSDATVETLWSQVTSVDGPPIRMSASAHIEQILDFLPEVLPYFIGRPWVLVRFDGTPLLTCDTPVALVPGPKSGPNSGLGLGTAWGITLPMSRHVGLIMASPMPTARDAAFDYIASGGVDFEDPPTSAHANMLNGAILVNAREWIFHHPDDADLVPDELPDPRVREMEISNTNFAQPTEPDS